MSVLSQHESRLCTGKIKIMYPRFTEEIKGKKMEKEKCAGMNYSCDKKRLHWRTGDRNMLSDESMSCFVSSLFPPRARDKAVGGSMIGVPLFF